MTPTFNPYEPSDQPVSPCSLFYPHSPPLEAESFTFTRVALSAFYPGFFDKHRTSQLGLPGGRSTVSQDLRYCSLRFLDSELNTKQSHPG